MRKVIGCVALIAGFGAVLPTTGGAQIPVMKDYSGTVQSTTTTTTTLSPVDTTQRVVEVSAGDLELYRGATDANIIAHVLTGDSLEVEMSRLALTRASSAAVRDFAQMMVDQHSQNSTYFRDMQARESIGIAPMVNDPIANQAINAISRLRGLSGAEFDRAFMRAQVAHHDAEVAALTWMAENSRDDDIEEDFEGKLIPTVRQHLVRARELAGQVGADVSMYRMTP